MKVVGVLLFFAYVSSAIAAPTCDCTTYPFKPNPPCYGLCIKKLSSKQNPDLFAIKDLDPGVSVNVKVLSSSPDKSDIDFAKIRDKHDLEKVALKSLENKNIKLEFAAATPAVLPPEPSPAATTAPPAIQMVAYLSERNWLWLLGSIIAIAGIAVWGRKNRGDKS